MTEHCFSDFRAAHPDCALLVLSDTRCGTVLAANGALAYPQEYLDAVSAMASDMLSCTGHDGPWAVFLAPHAARIVLSAPHLGDAALTCVAHPDADMDALLNALRVLVKSLQAVEVAA